jgi:hypothetical protein
LFLSDKKQPEQYEKRYEKYEMDARPNQAIIGQVEKVVGTIAAMIKLAITIYKSQIGEQ